jgi:lipoprotein-anchoring transpeptidase ErfK/SrfK
VAIESARVPDDNKAMMRPGQRTSIFGGARGLAWAGVAFFCVLLVPLPASTQPRTHAPIAFAPTIEDPAPGVDHGNTSDNLGDQFQRQAVFYRSQHPVGTIIIDTADRHLYLIESETRALRYGIGVGRDGFTWAGMLQISRKAEWPDWHPPPEMIERQPYLPRFMAGGPGNPLGARAMYLGNTVYRIHGTNAPETIGHAVSSGCFRLVNEDVMDLYDRVPIGTRVIVRQN